MGSSSSGVTKVAFQRLTKPVAAISRELATLRKEVAALEAQIKQLGGAGEPINLPNPLSARRSVQ